MRLPPSFAFQLLLILAGIVGSSVVCTAEPPANTDDIKEVKRILATRCAVCHGPEKQKGGLRLDRKADLFAGGDSGKVIIANRPDDSALVKRITSRDAEQMMPPKGERLSAAEVKTISVWIRNGAKWNGDDAKEDDAVWWSFQPINKPAVDPKTNPIDSFIRAKLRDKKLTLAPQADRRTLIRRLYFDLLGLPPTPSEIEAFASDRDPQAFEKLVDKLLAQPQYGERWARHWLDIVHFGETHGYDKDQPRPNAWPYRDYVIRSFNEDKPYERFLREQIAGDVLFPNTRDGKEALGFLSAGPWDFIGHAEVPESKIDGKVARHLDRDDVVANTMSTFVGLTVHCAQCHNHKFDPISQEDYYRLQAVFAALDRADAAYDADPKVAARRRSLSNEIKAFDAVIRNAEAKVKDKAGSELAEIDKQLERSRNKSNSKPAEFGYHSEIASKQTDVKWVQVDLGQDVALDRIVLWPSDDDFNGIGAGFGFPLRYRVELCKTAEFQNGVIVVADRTAHDEVNPKSSSITIQAGGKTGRYLRVTATKLSPRQSNDFNFALAELEAYDRDGKNRAAKAAVSAFDSIEAPVRWRKSNLTDGLHPNAAISSDELKQLTQKRSDLFTRVLDAKTNADVESARIERKRVEAEIKALPAPQKVYSGTVHTGSGTFIGTGANGGKPRPIFVLSRGDVTKPGKEVMPGTLRSVPGLSGDFKLAKEHSEGDSRAALANWIADRNNPLTWRVMANRIWQHHFGKGLVDTPNDFGKMGQRPSHPELLDWLAAELRDKQSLKSLHRIILISETYQQSSQSRPEGETIDADNHLLWHQHRRKLDAESVRDSILAVAGKLDLTMGGPSFQDFVVEKPEHSPHYEYQLHNPEDPKSHRRAIYRFIVRSKQQPFLASLDCADPSLSVEKRNETQTPQQALALLNNGLTLVMAKHFAERVQKSGANDSQRIAAAFELALGRRPDKREADALNEYVRKHGLANGCRAILNLNEFMYVD